MKIAVVNSKDLRLCRSWRASLMASGCVDCSCLSSVKGDPCAYGHSIEAIKKRVRWYQQQLNKLHKVHDNKTGKLIKKLNATLKELQAAKER